MATTSSKPAAEQAAAAAMFSYAQAAKGRSQTSSGQSGSNNGGSDSTGTQKDAQSSPTTPAPSVNGAGQSEAGDHVAETNGSADKAVTGESTSDTPAEARSSATSPTFGSASTATLPKEEDVSSAPNTAGDSAWEKQSQRSAVAEKPAEATENKKGKKSKKAKEAEKAAEKEAEREREEEKLRSLVAAPMPSVNIWKQRSEAQAAAKGKVSSPQQAPAESVASNSSPRSAESKRKGKSLGAEDADRVAGAGQNGSIKDSSVKGQKKGPDGAVRGRDEAAPKRVSPRGERNKEDRSAGSQALPPVEDAVSWPTPETALEEEKRKAQEKVEKDERDDNVPSKPRAKKEWVAVAYTPSAVFNTPLPARGGRSGVRGGSRGARETGGRGGHPATGGVSGEKGANGTIPAGADNRERSRHGSSVGRSSSLPPPSDKRGSSGAPAKEQQKSVASGHADKSQDVSMPKNEQHDEPHSRRASVATQTDESAVLGSEQRHSRGEQGYRSEQTLAESHAHPRPNGSERKSESDFRPSEYFKPAGGYVQGQPRADGRPERGRPSRGARGGGHGPFAHGQHPQQAFANGHVQSPNGYPVRANGDQYSPPLQQAPYGAQYGGPTRGGRGGPRGQPLQNGAMFGRFLPNGAGPHHMGPPGGHEFQQGMAGQPFSPYIDQFSVLSMVSMQLEYYFSIDNLCKDVFLRKHMDSQGFVFLNFIATFKRVQQLTQDLELIRYACQNSTTIEIYQGPDGVDRLRRREGWQQWVMPIEERDESVRNDGPTYVPRPSHQRPQHMDAQMQLQMQSAGSPQAFSPNGTENGYRPYPAFTGPPGVNGLTNGDHSGSDTTLSAAVADFSPSLPPLNGAQHVDAETTFSDDAVSKLTIVFKASRSRVPFHNASSRTFSNGSIDGRSIAQEMQDTEKRQDRSQTSGTSSTEAYVDPGDSASYARQLLTLLEQISPGGPKT